MWRRGQEKVAGSRERAKEIESLRQSRHWENVPLGQDARNVAMQVRTQ